MLADMVQRALADRVEVEVRARFGNRRQMVARLNDLHPDLVVIALRRGEDDSIGRATLEALPRAIVVAISNDLHNASVFSMRPHRTVLSGFSRRRLAAHVARLTRISILRRTI